jgi:nitrite reductase/ring-hydroxylating ferredoxin subunit
VADAGQLHDGETLRVEIGDTVMAIARLEGKFYAFQEFCTHRFGPLSEGSFENGQVICPWHGSCFDLRTGKAIDGPAKVDIKVFPTEERDGKICVQVSSLPPQGPKAAKAERSARSSN